MKFKILPAIIIGEVGVIEKSATFTHNFLKQPGKRRLWPQAASYQFYATLVRYDVSKLIVLNRLNRAFINVLASQELSKLAQDQTEIAKEVLRIARKRVEQEFPFQFLFSIAIRGM